MKKLTFLFLILSNLALSRGGASISPLPTNFIFPTPGLILFPGYITAAGNNPAALGVMGKAGAVQASYSSSSPLKEYFGGLAASSQKFGVGLGFLRDEVGSAAIHSGFAGIGFQVESIALGAGVRKLNLSSSSSPSIDIGLIAGEGAARGQGLRFGFVAYGLDSSATLGIGLGYNGGKKYNLEVNALLPLESNRSNSTIITGGGNVYAGESFGLNFGVSFSTSSSGYLYKVGAVLWPWNAVSLFGQYAGVSSSLGISSAMWSAGLMVTF